MNNKRKNIIDSCIDMGKITISAIDWSDQRVIDEIYDLLDDAKEKEIPALFWNIISAKLEIKVIVLQEVVSSLNKEFVFLKNQSISSAINGKKRKLEFQNEKR